MCGWNEGRWSVSVGNRVFCVALFTSRRIRALYSICMHGAALLSLLLSDRVLPLCKVFGCLPGRSSPVLPVGYAGHADTAHMADRPARSRRTTVQDRDPGHNVMHSRLKVFQQRHSACVVERGPPGPTSRCSRSGVVDGPHMPRRMARGSTL